jgi:hypothetical protein
VQKRTTGNKNAISSIKSDSFKLGLSKKIIKKRRTLKVCVAIARVFKQALIC